MAQNLLRVIGLLDSDTDAYRVDGWLDEDAFGLIAGDDERVKKGFDGFTAVSSDDRTWNRG